MLSFLGSVPLPLLVGIVGCAVGAVAYVLLGVVEERSAARSTLRQLDSYEIDDQREKELLETLGHRLLTPLSDKLTAMGGRLNPPDYIESVKNKHLQAGIFSAERVERFLAIRILGFVLMPVWLIIMTFVNPLRLSGMVHLIFVIGGLIALAVVPNTRLNNKVETRQKAIQRSLPDVMDLLVISVEAGLGFEQAVDRVVQNVPGDLADEFARFLGETTAGASRSDALRSMQDRIDFPEIRSFVLAMIQADKFGVSIGRVLRAQADEMRIKRRQLAQERAQKAPVKMLIPMVFCIFPSLFVVILGPAAINIRDAFG